MKIFHLVWTEEQIMEKWYYMSGIAAMVLIIGSFPVEKYVGTMPCNVMRILGILCVFAFIYCKKKGHIR